MDGWISESKTLSTCTMPSPFGMDLYSSVSATQMENFRFGEDMLIDGDRGNDLIIVEKEGEIVASYFVSTVSIEQHPTTPKNDYQLLMEFNMAVQKKGCNGMRRCYLKRILKRAEL